MYVDKFPIDNDNQQRIVKRKMTSIFYILKNLGICEPYNKNTVKINREQLEKIALNEILKHKIGDFRNK